MYTVEGHFCISAGKRRRSSLFSSLTSLASVAFVSAIGNQPDFEHVSSSSSSEDEDDISPSKKLPYLDSVTSDTSRSVTFSLSQGTEETPDTSGIDNDVFTYDDETVSKYQTKIKNNQTGTDTNTVRIYKLTRPQTGDIFFQNVGFKMKIFFENAVLLMYTLEGVSSVANFITAYEVS